MPNIEIPSNPSELWIIAVVIILILTGVFTLLTLQQKNQTAQEIEKTEMMKSLLFDLQKRANDCIESEKESKEIAKVLVRENGELRNELENKKELIRKLRALSKNSNTLELSDTDELLLK